MRAPIAYILAALFAVLVADQVGGRAAGAIGDRFARIAMEINRLEPSK